MSIILCFKCKKIKKNGLISSTEELNDCCLCDDKEISQMLREINKSKIEIASEQEPA